MRFQGMGPRLDSLAPPEDRHLVEQKYIAGATIRELALNLKMTEKAVESLLTRSRLALKEQLGKRFKEPAIPGGNWL